MCAALRLAFGGALALASVVASAATVINFDDLAVGTQLNGEYAGVTWMSSTDDAQFGFESFFNVYDDTGYSDAHSEPNYVFNEWGVDSLSFAFPEPVILDGIAFATAGAFSNATHVRVLGDGGVNLTGWIELTPVSTFYTVNLVATTFTIERMGGPDTPQWYTMDDVTWSPCVVPEPTTMALLLPGLALLRRRKNAR